MMPRVLSSRNRYVRFYSLQDFFQEFTATSQHFLVVVVIGFGNLVQEVRLVLFQYLHEKLTFSVR